MPTSDDDYVVSFSAYLQFVVLAQRIQPSWRKGQTYFNVLEDHRPDLADRVRGTAIDPFHCDCLLSQFLSFVRSEW